MQVALHAFLLLMLVWLSWVDLRTYRLPDAGTFPLIAAGLLSGWLQWGAAGLWDGIVSAALGYLSFAAVALVYRAWRGRDGLGLGDAKLLAAAGAWLGWFWLPPVVFIGALSALVYVLLLRGAGRSVSLTSRVPFGPFLALGFYSCWLLKLNGLICSAGPAAACRSMTG